MHARYFRRGLADLRTRIVLYRCGFHDPWGMGTICRDGIVVVTQQCLWTYNAWRGMVLLESLSYIADFVTDFWSLRTAFVPDFGTQVLRDLVQSEGEDDSYDVDDCWYVDFSRRERHVANKSSKANPVGGQIR